MAPSKSSQASSPVKFFPGALGAFLGLCLLKFGNPPVMENLVVPPENAYEFVLGTPWPLNWGLGLLALVAIFGAARASWRIPVPKWLMLALGTWLAWQFIAAGAAGHPMAWKVVLHFAACALCFCLGVFVLSRAPDLTAFWGFLLGAFALVIANGFSQQFGGLEATRKYFYLYIYPQMSEVPSEYLQKIASTRIFSTLFYPNALAGVLLLLMPALLIFILNLRRHFTIGARVFLSCAIGITGLLCLYWSGSKGGWLLAMALCALVLFRFPFPQKIKLGLITVLIVAGLTGFFVTYASFFQKGATSVGARFDYWQAALRIFSEHPGTGIGPGLFGPAYQAIKRPESEPSRLVHNDYLQQASDSGAIGFLAYAAFIAGMLWLGYPETRRSTAHQVASRTAAPALDLRWPEYAIWLGVLGFGLQSLIEFSLYIPALAWPAFVLGGWLVAQRAGMRSALKPNGNC